MIINIPVDIPDVWLKENSLLGLSLTDKQKHITENWAKMIYLTGDNAETWVRNNSKYNSDGTVQFYEAVLAIEKAIFAMLISHKESES